MLTGFRGAAEFDRMGRRPPKLAFAISQTAGTSVRLWVVATRLRPSRRSLMFTVWRQRAEYQITSTMGWRVKTGTRPAAPRLKINASSKAVVG
jgi:hypothetical protein